jgi:hypothetical protein
VLEQRVQPGRGPTSSDEERRLPLPHRPRANDSTVVVTPADILRRASVTTRHYARPIDDRDAQVAKHLDQLGSAKPTGTQRARKPRKKDS